MFQCKKHVLNNNSYKYNYYIYFSYFLVRGGMKTVFYEIIIFIKTF